MPDWVYGLFVGTGGGGLVGYLLRGWIDDRFAREREARKFRQEDRRRLRDDLFVFLGQPRAHFDWLENVRDVHSAGGTPSPDEKAQLIAEWVYGNAARYALEVRRPMYRIANVAYMLANGDRHFLDLNPNGYEVLQGDWSSLELAVEDLTRTLHNPDSA